MFNEACRTYLSVMCHVGAGSEVRGVGCWISATHVITSGAMGIPNSPAPWATISDRRIACRTVVAAPPEGIAVLEINDEDSPDISRTWRRTHPSLSFTLPQIGAEVGCMGLSVAPGGVVQPWFSVGVLAGGQSNWTAVFRDVPVVRGAIGAPVFRADGTLVAIVTSVQSEPRTDALPGERPGTVCRLALLRPAAGDVMKHVSRSANRAQHTLNEWMERR